MHVDIQITQFILVMLCSTRGTKIVTCSSVIFKSLINVITFINETQVFICDKSNFIYNPLCTSAYIQAVSREDLPLLRGIPIYIQACHVIVI